jgi:hypothetical protein
MAGTRTTEAKRAVSELERTRAFQILARAGYAVAGVLHVIIGVIAISIGFHAKGGEADQSGAMRSVAQAPGGTLLLVLMIAGLAALGFWQVARGITAGGGRTDRWKARLSAWGQAVGYLALAGIAISVAGGGGSGGGGGEKSMTAALLAAPGGVVLIVAIGAGVLGGGVWFVVKGVRRTFLDDLEASGGWRRPIEVVGIVGHLAKGVALAVLGVLVIVAAVTADPDQAGGLDQAFQALARAPFGEVLVILTGIGFIAYGVYCGFRARFARL